MLHRAGYPRELGNRERAERFYPRAYDPLMRSAAGEEGIDPAFWFAVVREESMFSSSVASHAGAVGLSQLMPATAEDVADRMGLTGPELTDPQTNLAIGSRYLRMLLDRFELPVAALAAYNAGQGRVRRWLAAAPEGMVAFHERIPFWETRHHVRKVVVSAVYYNYLYNDVPPVETVRYFFPGLKELEE
jgi:soluble lytic murein transglycosylase